MWCNNILEINGKGEEIEKFIEKLGGEAEGFRFGIFWPMPREFRSASSNSRKQMDIMFGVPSAVEWSKKHYGLGEDIDEPSCYVNCFGLKYRFTSLEEPPILGLEKISALFPQLTFDLQFEASHDETCGHIKFFKGEIIGKETASMSSFYCSHCEEDSLFNNLTNRCVDCGNLYVE